jgi:hypothetical protein
VLLLYRKEKKDRRSSEQQNRKRDREEKLSVCREYKLEKDEEHVEYHRKITQHTTYTFFSLLWDDEVSQPSLYIITKISTDKSECRERNY